MLTFLVAVCGGLGAAARFVVDGVLRSRQADGRLPAGTFVVNVSGSLALGLLVGAQLHLDLGPAWVLVAGTGFCGGYTTFSTAMVEAVGLHRDGRHGAGTTYLAVMVAACVGVATLGVGLTALIGGGAP